MIPNDYNFGVLHLLHVQTYYFLCQVCNWGTTPESSYSRRGVVWRVASVPLVWCDWKSAVHDNAGFPVADGAWPNELARTP